MKILISGNPELLQERMNADFTSVTVEAEYGNMVVHGVAGTRAHHGHRQGDPPPCMYLNSLGDDIPKTIGVSHFDLDCLGGVLAVLGRKPEDDQFWRLAAQVDVFGLHRRFDAGGKSWNLDAPSQKNLERLYAFRAWSDSHRLIVSKDAVIDCTEFFEKGEKILTRIFAEDAELIQKGKEHIAGMEILNRDSFVCILGSKIKILLRKSPGPFVNHLSISPDGKVADAVISYNERTGAITLSFEREGIADASELMISAFGPKAGGSAGIAGSPRGERMNEGDISKVIELLNKTMPAD